MKKWFPLSIAVAALWLLPSSASAAIVYVNGNTCPSDPLDASFNRQYKVTEATECVYDSGDANIQGNNTEANDYLNSADAITAGWPGGFVGLGQSPTGFSFTGGLGGSQGTFTIDTSILTFGLFGVGVKDGGAPKWAIFLVDVADLTCVGTLCTGNWDITTQGGLSHFALYGSDFIGEEDEPQEVEPEPATLLLLGTGLALTAARVRGRSKARR